jgi:DNA polymerase-1
VTENFGNPDLHLVDDVDSAQRFLAWLGERRPILAIDTETTGLDWWEPNFCRLVQFGDGASGWAISVRNWRGVIETALQHVQDSGVPTGWWNLKFDAHALEVTGLPLPSKAKAHDGVVMHHLLASDERHGLKPVSEARYGDVAVVGDRMLKMRKAENGWDWATVPEDEPSYWAYAACDTVLTARNLEWMWPRLQPVRAAYEREMAALWVMYGAECRGMRVDATYAGLLRNKWLTTAGAIADSLKAEGIKNPNSNKQITDALEAAGWEADEFTPSGAVKLDKAILLQLQRTFPGDMAERILAFRRLLKWSKAYLQPFEESGGLIHPSINVLGARTGRMSISKPPLQQLPARGEGGKLIRTAVLPTNDGDQLYACDYDGQELRLHAHYSGSTNMIEAFRQGIDPHTFTASLAYGVPMEQVTKELRAPAKNTRYSALYGAGPAKIAATAGVSVEVIEGLVNAIKERFPEEAEFAQRIELKARERWADEGKPYVVSWGGRRIVGDGDKLYALINYLIQGSAADVLKDRLIALNAAGLGDAIVVPVHDEVLFSLPAGEEGLEMAKVAQEVMTMPDQFQVPLTVGCDGPLNTWGDKYGE